MLHTREHYTPFYGEINLNYVEFYSLPLGMGGFLPHPDITMLYDVEDDELPNNVTPSTRFYSPLFNEIGLEKVMMYPNDLLFLYAAPGGGTTDLLCLKQISSNIPRCEFITLNKNQNATPANTFQPRIVSVKSESEDMQEDISQIKNKANSNFPVCSECGQHQKSTMVDHFLGQNKPDNESLKCDACNYIAPTECSLSAHVRFHDDIAPHVCPECGKDFPSSQQLNDHLDLVCFHLAKEVRFRCPAKKCGKLFVQIVTFTAHFMTHMQCLNKCSICVEKYFQDDELAEHVGEHDGSNVSFEKVYKCSVCPEAYPAAAKSELKEHVESHVSEKTHRVYAYICRKCRTYIRSSLAYANHLLRCPKFNQNQGANEDVDTRNRAHFVTTICFTCHTKFRYKINVARFKPVICPTCGKKFETTVAEIPPTNKCVLCNLVLKPSEKETHKLKCKYSRPVVELICDDLENPKILADYLKESAKKRKKKSSSVPMNKSKKPLLEESDLYLEAGKPVEFDGIYRCKLCEYVNDKRDEFHIHVVSHRDVSTSYQCMECGECFVVKPSLVKHLHYFHKVSNTEEYFEVNNCFDKDAVKELEETMKLAPGEIKGPVEENQCRVCLKKFENDLELKKHFRVHGMAFLLHNSK